MVTAREALQAQLPAREWPAAASVSPAADLAGLVAQGQAHGFRSEEGWDPDAQALRDTVIFGLRGIAAYADHASLLGQESEEVYAFLHEALAAATDPGLAVGDWVGLALATGKANLKAMEILDAGNTGTYGHPVPTVVPLGHKQGKAILVSGHDLLDLKQLLEQTQGKGIYVYSHGEMLPTHGYPELKKYPHFYGHYGTAWQNQGKEFPLFPGAILMTTNCIQRPAGDVAGKIFTTGLVGWPGVPHIKGRGAGKDFAPVIQKALELPGFAEDAEAGSVMVGFGHHAVLSVADQVIAGAQERGDQAFFLVGGCDGASPDAVYTSSWR